MTGKINKNYSLNFFGRLNGDFSVSPQNYYKSWRKQKGLDKAFIGPWDYAGGSPGSKPKRLTGPQDTVGIGSRRPAKGFISPVDGYAGPKKRYVRFNYGDQSRD